MLLMSNRFFLQFIATIVIPNALLESFEKQYGLCNSSLHGGNMSNVSRNQEVVKKFLASKAFDFAAFGKFVAENGGSIASSEDSEFGFIIGSRFIRYCIPPVTVVNEGVNPAELRNEVAGD